MCLCLLMYEHLIFYSVHLTMYILFCEHIFTSSFTCVRLCTYIYLQVKVCTKYKYVNVCTRVKELYCVHRLVHVHVHIHTHEKGSVNLSLICISIDSKWSKLYDCERKI